MITREDLNGKSLQDMQKFLEEGVNNFKVEIEALSEDETLQREQELMRVMEEYDGVLRTVVYDIPEQCTFDGQVFNRKTVGEFIVDVLNTQEVEWSLSLGMYELAKLWKNKEVMKINYHAYDSTLRVLGQCKFKGFDNWRKILTINEFLGECHDNYVADTNYMIYLSQLHNALLDVLKKFNPDMDKSNPDTDETINEG